MTRSPARAADVPHPAPVLLGMPRLPRSFRVEFSSSLVSELVSGVKPVTARTAGSQQAQQPGIAPASDPDRHRQQTNQASCSCWVVREAATTLESHDEGLPRIPISHRELQAHHQ